MLIKMKQRRAEDKDLKGKKKNVSTHFPAFKSLCGFVFFQFNVPVFGVILRAFFEKKKWCFGTGVKKNVFRYRDTDRWCQC